MNERIRELAEQAGFFPEPNWDHTAWHAAGHDNTFEKFAELIVRECMVLCKTTVGNADYNTGRLHCLENIREHFGVEE